MFDVCLILPYLPEAAWKNDLREKESLALGYLTAFLKKNGFNVVSINAELLKWSPQRIYEEILSYQDCRLIGISCTSQRLYEATKMIAKLLKQKQENLHITVGGIFPTVADQEILNDCTAIDSIVRGEGELTLLDLPLHICKQMPTENILGLISRKGDKIIVYPSRPRMQDLDMLPWPDRKDLEYLCSKNNRNFNVYIMSSRGCYGCCSFCSIGSFYKNHQRHQRSPENVVGEIEYLVKNFRVNRFQFVDDVFIDLSPKRVNWVKKFCNIIRNKKLKIHFYTEIRPDAIRDDIIRDLRNAGLETVFLDIESGVDRILKRYNKGVTEKQNGRLYKHLKRLA